MARERSKNREENQSLEPQRRQQAGMQRWGSFSPFGTMRRFFDDMDRMIEGFGFPAFERFGSWPSMESFSPHVDVFEREGKFVISADLPGLNKDEVKVDVFDDSVVIEGERKYEHEQREEGVYRSERGYGHFRRQIPLPQGAKTDTATANFKNGVLEIVIEAPQLSKNPKRIQIQGDESSGKAA
jgi:HSP20 family protein